MLNNDFGWHPHSLEPGQKSKLSEFIPDDYNRAFPVRKKAGIFGDRFAKIIYCFDYTFPFEVIIMDKDDTTGAEAGVKKLKAGPCRVIQIGINIYKGKPLMENFTGRAREVTCVN